MSGRAKGATEILGNYLVGLQVNYVFPGSEEMRSEIVSGFIVEINERWIWATAGHFIKDIDKNLSGGKIEITGGQWIDHLGTSPIDEGGYPVMYFNLSRMNRYSEELGIDIGFVLLDQLTQQAMSANGIKSLSPESCVSPSIAEFDRYWLSGLPKEWQCPDGNSITVANVALPLIPCADPPECLIKPFPRFYANIVDIGELQNIQGMSGGPVFGFKAQEDGTAHVYLIGLQNGWDKKKCIAACEGDRIVPMFFAFVDEMMRRDCDEQQ